MKCATAKHLCVGLCALVLACLLTKLSPAQSAATATSVPAPRSVITLDAPSGWDLQEHAFNSQGTPLPEAPANFRRLGEVRVGEVGAVHALTLRFAQTVRLTRIESSPDFRVEPGGSCAEGGQYEGESTCTLLVRFTPKGPGNRLGHLRIAHSDSASVTTYSNFGLGGYSYTPVISFIPAVITTVKASYPSNVGLLSGAHNLWIDGGDTLWVSDTGNGVVRALDSGGAFRTLATGYTSPWGITVDTFGQAYFDTASAMFEIYDYGPVVQASGAGTAACTVSTPCTLSSEGLGTPGEMSMDQNNRLFFVDSHQGAAFATVQPIPANLIFLYDPFPYQQSPSAAMAVDANDNMYSLWGNGGVCEIVQQSLYNAENSNVAFNKIAGGHTCGFAGDGGMAGNAEIGNSIGQIAFDAAGDMYFSDTQNQRVRRIEYNNGIIRTIAGNGTAGYTGDTGRATAANLNNPTGVGVDSQGAVYIISSATTGQVIRKVGPQGIVGFGAQPRAVASAPQFVTVTNSGNGPMVLTNVAITGANPADFKVDSTTTTCMLTPGASLASGQTCLIGVIFTPAVVGARNATLSLLDNTVIGSDNVTLYGSGILRTPTLKITSPANGSSFVTGTAVTLSASVTFPSAPQPTGTVQFKVDGVNRGSPVTLSSTGTASISVTGLTVASHTLSATYNGDTYYAAAGPVSVSITVTATVPARLGTSQTVPFNRQENVPLTRPEPF